MTINPFEFRTVPAMEVAWGGAKRLGDIIKPRFSARKALLVTDAGLVKAGLIAPIAESLTAAGISVSIFDKVIADPPEHIVHGCVEEARLAGVDIVIGLGGGSSLDIAKLVAVLLVADQPLAEMYGIGKVQGSRLPLVLVCQRRSKNRPDGGAKVGHFRRTHETAGRA